MQKLRAIGLGGLFGFLFFIHAHGQVDNMITAQPGFYIGPAVIPAGSWQVENTFMYEGYADGGGAFTLPTSMVRYGIVPGFEVRARYGLQISDSGTVGAYPLALGIKTVLIKGAKKRGAIALRFSMRIPKTGSNELNPVYLAPEILLATRQSLGPKTGLFIDGGIAWSATTTPVASGKWALALEQALSPDLTFFIEPYGSFNKNEFHHDYDMGFIYLFNPNLQIDLSGGTGFSNKAYDGWFVSGGLSFRVLKKSDRIRSN